MPLAKSEIRRRAVKFSSEWAGASHEKSQAQMFWYELMNVFGVKASRVVTFEHRVKTLPNMYGKTDGYVDMFWPGRLLVEHKSLGKDLDEAMGQAMGYLDGVVDDDMPELVVVCDFRRIRVRRLAAGGNDIEFTLDNLYKNTHLFNSVAGYKTVALHSQDPVNRKAAERMGVLHDELEQSGYSGHRLEMLLVRLLFCLFADDTAIFSAGEPFRGFIETRTSPDGSDLGPQLAYLFQVLNEPVASRSATLDEQLADFPYVNGGLFAETLPAPACTPQMRQALLLAASLDWSQISPAIFGSLFQSIMDPVARRNLGAHYTSEENILKVIKPLFLDDLRAEFDSITTNGAKLDAFLKKLRTLRFLDPACGCGNFLVVAYRELRRLELDAVRQQYTSTQLMTHVDYLLNVNVDQFYGIEIEEFPAQIARTALWLTDHQMNMAASEEFGQYFARIPLTTTATITHGNALLTDWEAVLPAADCTYVMGNPPFVGAKLMTPGQRADADVAMGHLPSHGLLDMVAAWYVKTVAYLNGNPGIEAALVSTNSICQGEQPGVLWKWLLEQGVRINFAYRTFKWGNEGRRNAAVHCVIIGFTLWDRTRKVIYQHDHAGTALAAPATNINPYLVDAVDVTLPRRTTPLSKAPEMVMGNKPIDDGNYLFTTAERDQFIADEPASAKWFRRWMGSQEFLHSEERWCLWVGHCPPAELHDMPSVMKRVAAVKNYRESRHSAPTRALAATPTRFHIERSPQSKYLLIPKVSSETRDIIPIGFIPPDVMSSDLTLIVPNATLYHFGVMTSRMHMAWISHVCGRLESRYRYSVRIVYNNFPWPNRDPQAKSKAVAKVEVAAQAVLDARDAHLAADPTVTLAELYDPLSMPAELRKAHTALDRAVDGAYRAADNNRRSFTTDADRVAYLFDLYQKLAPQ